MLEGLATRLISIPGLTSECFPVLLVQEEIKIISVTVFVNPYMEPDEEEEEEKGKGEKTAEDEDNVSFGLPILRILDLVFIFLQN